MKIFKWLMLIAVCGGLTAPMLWADVIIFKSGKEITVKKVWEDEDAYNCYRFGKLVKYPKVTIKSVEKTDQKTSLPAFAEPVTNVPKWKCLANEPFKYPEPFKVRTNYTKPGVDRTYKSRAFELAGWGYLDELQEMIEENPEIVFQTDRNGKNLLMSSVRDAKQIQYFLDKGLDINAGNDYGMTAIMFAVQRKNSHDAISLLARKGADLELVNDPARSIYNADKEGTAFMLAVAEEKYDNAALLIKCGTNINAYNSHGDTALHIALRGQVPKSEKKAAFLLKYASSLNSQNKWGHTPVESAVEFGRRKQVGKILEKAGVPMPSVPVMFGDVRTAIRVTAREQFQRRPKTSSFPRLAFAHGNIGMGSYDVNAIDILLRQNPDLAKQKDRFGRTLLHWAGEYCNVDAFAYLMDYGIPVNVQDSEGNTALHLWAEHNDAVKALLAKGADAAIKNNMGRIPLHFVGLQYTHSSDINALIKMHIMAGGSLNARDINGETPAQVSENRTFREIAASFQ
ncbi:ankyrin repeat domain-containing protein [Desulfatibacillum alkenivorans]|uniref:ankyrin repeat domain-containing protein n=1 Tax=Desulfatibacillum alkenivorans TaxID=259354 RepID=UPI00147B99B6|nr:ankyrin repeat domain-containing protein [Desulfatibacillum alkenivorans]